MSAFGEGPLPAGRSHVRDRLLLQVVFFLSGLTALIYQVVWQRLLTVHYGLGAVSIALIVVVYMLGLGLGALLGGLVAERFRARILCYVGIELALGVFGASSLALLDALGTRTAGAGHATALLCMFLFLCVPTILMGTTLPLLTKIFTGLIGDLLASVSLLYFVNTLGAAAGSLLSAYVLISFGGLDIAVMVAAGLNVLLAVTTALYWLARRRRPSLPPGQRVVATSRSPDEGALGRRAYVFVVVTGFLAIGYEIIWLRLIGVLVKDSPYAFSSILAVYLFGIAVGSYGMERYVRRGGKASARWLCFGFQLGLAVYVLVSTVVYYYLTRYTPLGGFTRLSFYTEAHPTFPVLSNGWTRENLVLLWSCLDLFLWPVVFLLVPTILMGATFPLVSLLASAGPGQEGRTVGRVYWFTIIGNVAGGLVTGFLLLPRWGTEHTLLVFIGVGLVLFALAPRLDPRDVLAPRRLVPLLGVLVAAILIFPDRGRLYEAMHVPPWNPSESFFTEGVEGVVLTYVDGPRVENYINGQVHGGRPRHSFYFEAIEALAYAAKPRHVLVIGYGTGSFVEVALRSRDVEKVTLVEINETLMDNLARIPLFRALLDDRRLEIILDDGRRHLLRTADRYDVILIDPLRTKTAYSGNLYSREFFSLAQRRLNPDGLFLLWLDEDRVLPRTLLFVFDEVRLYRFFAIGARSLPTEKNEVRWRRLLETFPPEDRQKIARNSDAYVGGTGLVRQLTAGYAINEDWRPISEYYLGLVRQPSRADVARSPSTPVPPDR